MQMSRQMGYVAFLAASPDFTQGRVARPLKVV